MQERYIKEWRNINCQIADRFITSIKNNPADHDKFMNSENPYELDDELLACVQQRLLIDVKKIRLTITVEVVELNTMIANLFNQKVQEKILTRLSMEGAKESYIDAVTLHFADMIDKDYEDDQSSQMSNDDEEVDVDSIEFKEVA